MGVSEIRHTLLFLFVVAGIYQIDEMVNTCDVSVYGLKDKDILLSIPG